MYEVQSTAASWTRQLWRNWIVDNVVGGLGGWLLFSRPAVLLTTPFVDPFALYVLLVVLSLCLGACIGFSQRALTRCLTIDRARWTLITGLSAFVGSLMLLGGRTKGLIGLQAIGTTAGLISLLTLLGACIGLTQWAVLRKKLRRAGWWIGATIAGAALGSGVGSLLARQISNDLDARVLLGLLVGMSIYALVTGACLRRLLP